MKAQWAPAKVCIEAMIGETVISNTVTLSIMHGSPEGIYHGQQPHSWYSGLVNFLGHYVT